MPEKLNGPTPADPYAPIDDDDGAYGGGARAPEGGGASEGSYGRGGYAGGAR